MFQERELALVLNNLRIKEPIGLVLQMKQLTDLMTQQPFQVVLADVVVMRRSLLLNVS